MVSTPLTILWDIQEKFIDIEKDFELLTSKCNQITQGLLSTKDVAKEDACVLKSEEEIQNFSININKNWATSKRFNNKNPWVAIAIDSDGKELAESFIFSEDLDEAEEDQIPREKNKKIDEHGIEMIEDEVYYKKESKVGEEEETELVNSNNEEITSNNELQENLTLSKLNNL